MKKNNTVSRGKFGSMIRVDSRRMFMTPLFYIMLAIALLTPILILVMTTMMEGSVVTDRETGVESVMEAMFTNTWQIIGSVSSSGGVSGEAGGAMAMDITSMCNINLLYFGVGVLVCIFIAGDFRSDYAKNIFAVRSAKTDYVASKLVIGTLASMLLVLGFFIGAVIGGAVAGLSFEMEGFNAAGLVFCVLGKMLLMGIFAGLYTMIAIIAKQRLWMSILLSLCTGMFLFMIVPIVTPLNATVIHALLCCVGSLLFCLGFGAISRIVLKKRDIL